MPFGSTHGSLLPHFAAADGLTTSAANDRPTADITAGHRRMLARLDIVVLPQNPDPGSRQLSKPTPGELPSQQLTRSLITSANSRGFVTIAMWPASMTRRSTPGPRLAIIRS